MPWEGSIVMVNDATIDLEHTRCIMTLVLMLLCMDKGMGLGMHDRGLSLPI